MSEDGRYVFFDTATPLVPRDTNNAYDVYRWGATDNSVRLLSTGTGKQDSSLQGINPSGTDAFIMSQSPLAPQDGDNENDLYDVRVDGGIPFRTPGECEGDACQGAAEPPSESGAPASETYAGPGDKRVGAKKKHKATRKRCVKKKHTGHRKHARHQMRCKAPVHPKKHGKHQSKSRRSK
jgi:hypothetical protein